jgi:hypothetical protein
MVGSTKRQQKEAKTNWKRYEKQSKDEKRLWCEQFSKILGLRAPQALGKGNRPELMVLVPCRPF